MADLELFCEDCDDVVTVYGYWETPGSPNFIEVERDSHDGHDLAEPRDWSKILQGRIP